MYRTPRQLQAWGTPKRRSPESSWRWCTGLAWFSFGTVPWYSMLQNGCVTPSHQRCRFIVAQNYLHMRAAHPQVCFLRISSTLARQKNTRQNGLGGRAG